MMIRKSWICQKKMKVTKFHSTTVVNFIASVSKLWN